jgi:hypothetical protein
LVDSLPGGIGLPQLVHVTRDSFSDITVTLLAEIFDGVPYICCAQFLGLDAALGLFVSASGCWRAKLKYYLRLLHLVLVFNWIEMGNLLFYSSISSNLRGIFSLFI